jgi:PIN domain nuclease of toxin-antitoxin system
MLLLDTHAFVWLASDQSQFPRKALAAIRASADGLHVSSITALEIGLLVKRGRLHLPVAAVGFVAGAMAQHGVHEIPVDIAIAHAAVALPDLHNDPFDRLIVATARIYDLRILTKDAIIPTYPGVVAVWR